MPPPKQEGDTNSKTLYVTFICGQNVMSAKLLGAPLLGVGSVLRLARDACGQWSNDQGKQQIETLPPPPQTYPATQCRRRVRE